MTATSVAALAAMHCKAGAPKLSAQELAGMRTLLSGWSVGADRLDKTFRFANYHETMAFANAVAYVAHREDHHPDLAIRYNRCDVAWSTHDAGGVTLNDCICAAKVDSLVA
jgi:4a-hydroxytetrahydrobiopterin dehydratase